MHMGRKSSRAASPAAAAAPEIPGCFNWNAPATAEADEIPPVVVARKSLSERKFSEGFEAPRNSLDISSAMFENARQASSVSAPPSDEIPFGFEFALRKSSSERVPPRVSVSNAGAGGMESGSNRCRSPSVIARLMGLDTLPTQEDESKPSSAVKHHQSYAGELQGWRLLSERREFLTSRSSREQSSKGDEQGKYLARQLSSSRLREWAQKSDDEFLLFDVLPFRDHPQEKQLEKLKLEFQAQRHLEQRRVQQQVQQKQSKPESREMHEAIQFLQSNKEFLVKFLREPNSVFSKHIYDLQALAAKDVQPTPRAKPSREAAPQQQQNNIGFSRKLVDSRRDNKPATKKEELVQKQQPRKDNSTSQEKIILLKSSSLKKPGEHSSSSREKEDGGLRRSRSFRDVDTSMDPKELAKQIARQARETINQETSSNHPENAGVEVSEPSSRRYNRDFRVSSTSLPNSPRGKSNVNSKEGRRQLKSNKSDDESPRVENRELFIQIELTRQKEEQQQQQQKKKGGGKLLKLFSRESSPEHAQKSSSDKSPRLLVRSKSVPSFVEEKKQEEALDRVNSCKQSSSRSSSPSENRGKFSSLKSSLLGKKKSHHSRTKSRSEPGEIEHSVIGSDDDHYIRTFRETEAQLATTYNTSENNKFAFDSQSPRFLSVNINDGLEHLDTSSDIQMEKSEQPSPVSVLERGFIEESSSPVSFEDVTSDLQELQMRLERLKLDESGRTYKPEKPEDILHHEADISPVVTPVYVPVNQDSVYVAKLIHTSGFANSIESLFNWHSPSCPIDPYLFGKLEADYSDSEAACSVQNSGRLGLMRGQRKPKIGRSLNRVERRPETLHRQMLFDVVNEVLSKRFQYLWNDQPWHEIGKQGINPVPGGRHLVQEVEREVELFRHEYDRGEYPLENLVERDVKRGGGGHGGGQWMETREELRKITSQLEAFIFNGLVEELACSLSSL